MTAHAHRKPEGAAGDAAPSSASHTGSRAVVMVRTAGRTLALPVADVVETMRPLPVEPQPGLPAIVAGVAVVRGRPLPVLLLSTLWGEASEARRFVVVRAGRFEAALAVDEVLGVVRLDAEAWRAMATLGGDERGPLEAVTASRDGLVSVLAAARLVSAEQWDLVLAVSAGHGAAR